MITQQDNHKTLTLTAHQLKGKNADAVLQAELLQLKENDKIKLPDDMDAKRSAMAVLKNLNTETVKTLVHKSKCCGYSTRDIFKNVKWDDTSLNILAESKDASGLIFDWYRLEGKYMGQEKILPIVSDDIALKAAITFASDNRSTSRYGSAEGAEAILEKFIDRLDLLTMAKNLDCARTVCRLAINTQSKELITILNIVYETAMETKNLKALSELACLNLNSQGKLAVITHLNLIQKIITMPEMIEQDDTISFNTTVEYTYILEHVFNHYRVGFSLYLPPETKNLSD
jgi:hypothetical protein